MFEQQGYGWEKYYVSAGFNTISYEGCRVGKYFFEQYKFIKKMSVEFISSLEKLDKS